MSQKQENEIPDDEEPEVTFTCDRCGTETTDEDYDSIAVRTGQHESEDWCRDCTETHSTYVDLVQDYIDDREIVRSGDTDEHAPIWYARDNWYYSGRHDVWYADSDSAPENQGSSDMPFSYHETNTIEQFGWPKETPKNSLCFGVELEMEHVDDSEDTDSSDDAERQSELVIRLGGRTGGKVSGSYLLMNDGSLGDSGVELITSPYTLEYHQTKFGWKELLTPMQGYARSGAGTTKCGMHVHVNRKALSALTLGKMLVFVNSNANTALIERVAQRNTERWAKRYAKSIANGKDETSDKYEALHLSEKTVEFRIFRGNLRPDRVLKNIEFCHSVAVYCRQASTKAVETYSDYVQWLGKNRSAYPNLVAFLGERYGFKINKNSKVTEEV